MYNQFTKAKALFMAILMCLLSCIYSGDTAYADTISTSNSTNNEVYVTFTKGGYFNWNTEQTGYKYEITIVNNSDSSICNWQITLNENYTVLWQNGWGWNANFSVNGNTLVITPQDSSPIAAHSTYSSAGFYLINTDNDTSNVQLSYEYGNINTNVSTATSNSGTTSTTSTSTVDTSGVNITGATKNLDYSQTPVGQHGELSVSGIHLVDKNGDNYQLRGVSTHGINWFPEYVNKECFQNLRDEWGVNAVRLAMYTTEYNGYCNGGDKTSLKNIVNNGVQYATELGMYVIIDWHILNDNNPKTYVDEAKTFFEEMSSKYAGYSNVIYEICNEPNGSTTWSDIKEYAETIIPIIKKNNPDAIIIVGTPNWSQGVDVAAQNPITGYSNIMYTLHFYSDTHQNTYRDKLVTALNAGLPVFCTEYGVCDSSGNGGLNLEQANVWLDLMDSYDMSYFCWSLTYKNETASLLTSDSQGTTSGFKTSNLSEAGKWLVSEYNKRNAASGSSTTNNSSTTTTNSNTTTNNGTVTTTTSNKNTTTEDTSKLDCKWNATGVYWYEGGTRQGIYGDAKNVVYDGTERGREIYDPLTDAWYWLDAIYDGAKAVSKEVFMPYVYQDEIGSDLDDAARETLAALSNIEGKADMSEQVNDAIKNHKGKWVRYDANGGMIKGWYTVEGEDAEIYPTQVGNTYYYDWQTGLMAKGWTVINGVSYYFDENSGVLKK